MEAYVKEESEAAAYFLQHFFRHFAALRVYTVFKPVSPFVKIRKIHIGYVSYAFPVDEIMERNLVEPVAKAFRADGA